jgi:hypothetical protein
MEACCSEGVGSEYAGYIPVPANPGDAITRVILDTAINPGGTIELWSMSVRDLLGSPLAEQKSFSVFESELLGAWQNRPSDSNAVRAHESSHGVDTTR